MSPRRHWWQRLRVTTRAALLTGLLGLAGAVTAALITRFPTSAPAPTPAPGLPSTQALKLTVEYLGFQDGSAQYRDVGCPNGHFFAVPSRQLATALRAADDEPDGLAWLAPLIVQLGLDTDLPPEDYVRVNAVDVEVTQYGADSSRPSILIRSTACADDDPGYADTVFLVVLPASPSRIPLLRPHPEPQTAKPAVVWQKRPHSIRLEVTARAIGWYRFTVSVAYRYRGNEAVARLPKSIEAYFPDDQPYDWYYGAHPLSQKQLRLLMRELNKWTPYGYPPKPAADSLRSGLQLGDPTRNR